MIFYTDPITCALFILIVIIQVLSALTDGVISKILTYANICLHIALVFVLLYIGSELSELVVLFMGSLLCYVCPSYIKVRLYKRTSNEERIERGLSDDL